MATYKVTVADETPAGHDLGLLKKGSSFGHDPELQGLVPSGHKLPAHLLLTLNNSDRQVAALNIDVGPVIRLIHPFYYSQGEEFAYYHQDDEIKFKNFKGQAEDSWPHKGLPSVLPTLGVKSVPIKGKPQRKWGDCSTIFVGDDVPAAQKYGGRSCFACSAKGSRLIASIPSRPASDLNIWNNNFVFAVFWFCQECKAITTHNECD